MIWIDLCFVSLLLVLISCIIYVLHKRVAALEETGLSPKIKEKIIR